MAKNKAHKQKFSSKHQLADKESGRAVKGGNVRKGVKAGTGGFGSKQQRQQAAQALRKKKLEATVREKRIGSLAGAPRIVGVIPANESGDPSQFIGGLCKAMGSDLPQLELPFTVSSKPKKMSVTFAWESACNEQDAVDVAKVADIVVLTLDASQTVQQTIQEIQEEIRKEAAEVDEDGRTHISGTTWYSDVGLCITDYTRDLIASLNAQGIPSVIVVLQNTHTFTERQRSKVFRVHQRYFMSMLPESTKVISIIGESDYDMLLRHIQVTKLRQLKWREKLPHMVVESGSYDEVSRKLVITGFLRGNSLSASQLMHVTNHGTFQIEHISAFRPESSDPDDHATIDESTEETRESLRNIQASETLEDAGLPTEADLAYEMEQAQTRMIRVPAGVSDYQAAWYDTMENEVAAEVMPISTQQEDVDRFVDTDAMSFRTAQTDVDFLKAEDVIRLERMTEEERAMELQRLKEEGEEEAWNPDIVDTPIDMAARHRFSKYRGMKGFQTGKWDPAENLPVQYGYIFKLRGYAKIRDLAIEKCAAGPVKEGQYVSVTLLDVPPTVWVSPDVRGCPLLIASGQLEHEQKWSVLHFQVQRSPDLDIPLKSKTAMLAHIGFRKFYVSPLFSDVSVGDRTKFARFFHETENFRIATFFGPISFAPCPIVMYEVPSLEEQVEGNALRLACFGAALPPNPDLLILKRAVLTGRVAVIHKKQIVVKYMFFDENDIRWFQPVDLYTKLGRRGKITKPVGTHGLFKATFNDLVMQHDVVCMDLYKRVFPKWTTVAFNVGEIPAAAHETDEVDEHHIEE